MILTGFFLINLSGCASSKQSSHTKGSDSDPYSVQKETALIEKNNTPLDYTQLQNIPQKKFVQNLELDSILRPEDIVLADSNFLSSNSLLKKERDKPFRIQVLSVADFEEAQTKKYRLSQTLGKPVDVFFEAPFYKLRFGHFGTRNEAKSQLAEIRRLGINGFVVQKPKEQPSTTLP
jgi:hypothetical protein